MNACHTVSRLTIVLMCSLAAEMVAAGAESSPPAITPQQIEADWLRQDALRGGRVDAERRSVTPQEDAAGGCDGVIDGKWGFHTQNEEKPWWQVDLGKSVALERIVLYNRCDGTAERNAKIIVLLSDDAENFRQAYQHDGSVFYGHSDKKPLSAPLDGAKGRYVRLTLPGRSYFHLDEVEIYAAGGEENIALRRPATQSSTSQWSVAHRATGDRAVGDRPKTYPTQQVIRRGLKLAESLRGLGVDVEAEVRVLRQLRVDRAGEEGDSAIFDRGEEGDGSVLDRGEEGDGAIFDRGEEGDSSVLDRGREGDSPIFAARKLGQSPGAREAYFRARWAVRKMALRNPLLDFERILFVKRVPPAFPHMSDQYYGWWSRPGGGIYVLEGFQYVPEGSWGGSPRVRCLTADWPEGSFMQPDLSHDGKRVVFAYCRFYPYIHDVANKVDKQNLPEDAFYQIYEMDIDLSEKGASHLLPKRPEGCSAQKVAGTFSASGQAGVRRLTWGKYDDFNARYLPNGEIVFLSTRKGQAVQCSRAGTGATATADLPDSYVRCGGGNKRPVPVFTLHRMDADGQNIRPISAFENFEWTPSVAADGRILYARWDYIDRFNGLFMSLWSTNPDGTNPQLVFGNYTKRPQCVFEARSIPGSQKLVFTAAAHHSNMGGSLALLDRTRGTESERPLRRLTPEVCFPETEGWPDHYFHNPYPLSEEYYLVAWSDKRLPPHSYVDSSERNPVNASGIYLYDAWGNLELLHRDPEISSMYPIPIRRRARPAVLPDHVDWGGPQEGRFLVQDVYRGLKGVKRGTIKRLRVVGVPPKVQPQMNSPVLGVSREDPGKFVLGTVEVEADGSAYFRVPSGISVFFQALDGEGLAVQTMRSLTYVQPSETLACIGCHEHRDLAPSRRGPPLAAMRQPSKLRPGPEGSWPLRYDRLVQPVLDRLCVSCHKPDADAPQAARFDLTAGMSYQTLISFGEKDLQKLAFEKDRSVAGDCPARRSKLLAMLTGGEGHYNVRLDADSYGRLVTWMDTYAQRLGHFSDEQEEELRQLRRRMAALLLEQ